MEFSSEKERYIYNIMTAYSAVALLRENGALNQEGLLTLDCIESCVGYFEAVLREVVNEGKWHRLII